MSVERCSVRYSLRYEGNIDFLKFLDVCRMEGVSVYDFECSEINDAPVTFSADVSLDQIRELLGMVVDGHIMQRTVMPEQ